VSKATYKVVADINGKLYSAMVAHIKELGVEYAVGKWTKPSIEGSVLYCFTKLNRAREYIKDLNAKHTTFRIFRCKSKNGKTCTAPISAFLDQKSILHFWGKGDAPSLYIRGAMTDCVVADEVMITKEVKA
jgi:hypothetical protein